MVFGREGKTGKRSREEIGIHSIRAGEIVGEHSILFALPSENIIVSHQALSRKAFSHGVVKAIEFLAEKEAGYFTFSDLLEA